VDDNDENNVNDIGNEIDYEKKIVKGKNGPKSCLLITGSHGTGKTMTINVILENLGYDIQIINFTKIKTNKNIKDIIEKIMHSTNIVNMLKGKTKNKIASKTIPIIEFLSFMCYKKMSGKGNRLQYCKDLKF